jgi:uncharacterized protein
MEFKSLSHSKIDLKITEGTFSGYASVFGGVDSYGDTIEKGAFADTLKTYGLPKMFFNHDSSSVPIGKWMDAEEDDKGLKLYGEFTKGNTLAEQVRAALLHQTIDGLSIGFRLAKDDYTEKDDGRVIHRITRLAETSIVTFPADLAARVDIESVKSEEIASLSTIRDFELFLRDSGAFSKSAAQIFIARAKQVFACGGAANQNTEKTEFDELLTRMKSIQSKLKA